MNCREALAELVYLYDLKHRLHALHEMGHGTDWDDYRRRLPIAWANARAALAAEEPAIAPFDREAWTTHSMIVTLIDSAVEPHWAEETARRAQALKRRLETLPFAIAARNP